MVAAAEAGTLDARAVAHRDVIGTVATIARRHIRWRDARDGHAAVFRKGFARHDAGLGPAGVGREGFDAHLHIEVAGDFAPEKGAFVHLVPDVLTATDNRVGIHSIGNGETRIPGPHQRRGRELAFDGNDHDGVHEQGGKDRGGIERFERCGAHIKNSQKLGPSGLETGRWFRI